MEKRNESQPSPVDCQDGAGVVAGLWNFGDEVRETKIKSEKPR
jgi:hypothetical protein